MRGFVNWNISYVILYLGLRSGGPKQLNLGIRSLVGFFPLPDSPDGAGGLAEETEGVQCSFLGADWGDRLWPRRPRLRLGERQRRRALNWRSSSPSRLPREVRRTGLLRLGRRRLRRERDPGERWK